MNRENNTRSGEGGKRKENPLQNTLMSSIANFFAQDKTKQELAKTAVVYNFLQKLGIDTEEAIAIVQSIAAGEAPYFLEEVIEDIIEKVNNQKGYFEANKHGLANSFKFLMRDTKRTDNQAISEVKQEVSKAAPSISSELSSTPANPASDVLDNGDISQTTSPIKPEVLSPLPQEPPKDDKIVTINAQTTPVGNVKANGYYRVEANDPNWGNASLR